MGTAPRTLFVGFTEHSDDDRRTGDQKLHIAANEKDMHVTRKET
jgi:hypothetical protein